MLVKKFLTGEKDLSEEGLFGKKQYQGLDKVYEFGQKNCSKYLANKTNSKTKTKDMNYDSKSNFNKYRISKKIDSLSFNSKSDYLKEFHDKLEQLKRIKSTKEKYDRKNLAYDNTSDLCNSLLSNHEHQYIDILDKILVIYFLMIMHIVIILVKNQKPLKKN